MEYREICDLLSGVGQPDSDMILAAAGQTVEKVNSCKYLGIIIDDGLKWNLHIENIYKQLMKYISIFYKLRD